MFKKLCLSEIAPMRLFESFLLRERDKFCSETNTRLGTVRIVIKKKKVINRGE